jgi:putative membrane protein
MTRQVFAVCAVMVLGGGVVGAQEPLEKTKIEDVDDRTFVQQAASGGMAEVELAKMASKKASAKEVKGYAKTMIRVHGQANRELKTIAAKKKYPMPTSMTTEQKEAYNELAKLKGQAFDERYMEVMTDEHRKMEDVFKQVIDRGQDDDLKSWAQKNLPVIQEHLEHAKQTEKKVD